MVDAITHRDAFAAGLRALRDTEPSELRAQVPLLLLLSDYASTLAQTGLHGDALAQALLTTFEAVLTPEEAAHDEGER